MATKWRADPCPDAAWRPTPGISRAERADEQDQAAGSREARVIALDDETVSLASISLRVPRAGRRIYAYLRWGVVGTTVERYVGEVAADSRKANLAQGWAKVRELGILPLSGNAHVANSWASTPGVRAAMHANTRRDTRPERALRSALHAMGLRYRVDKSPERGIGRADVLFTRPKVAVFVDGCFWHGCPIHYRAPGKNAEYWESKLVENHDRDRHTDAALAANGWRVIRVWEHENLSDAAGRIADTVRARATAARSGAADRPDSGTKPTSPTVTHGLRTAGYW